MYLTPLQKQIGRFLHKRSMTTGELAELLGTDRQKIAEQLDEMVKLNLVVEKEGKWQLSDFVKKMMERRKAVREGEEGIVLKLIIEGISKSKEALRTQMDLLERKLKAEPIEIRVFERSEPNRQDDSWSAFIDTEVKVNELRDAVYLIFNYGPSYVEILHPNELRLKQYELQGILGDMAEWAQNYTHLILRMRGLV